MDTNENKEGSSVKKPGCSKDNLKKPDTSPENAEKDKKRDCDDSLSSDSCWSMMELKMGDQKMPPHAGTKKMKPEKKGKKRRIAGRVDKRKRRRGRFKRRPIMKLKTRAPSVSSENSHHSDSPRPRCKYCGHRCCMQREESRALRTVRSKKKARAQRTGKVMKKMLSECNQIGSRCTMLSPLFINTNSTPQEPAEETVYCEITPQMIHHSVQELTMRRESVPSSAILVHLQANYPVNPNAEEAANELADKLFIANLIDIVWSLPDDHWRLTTALEKASKLEENHVTLFWRMYADTMRPLDINRKSRLTRSDAQTEPC